MNPSQCPDWRDSLIIRAHSWASAVGEQVLSDPLEQISGPEPNIAARSAPPNSSAGTESAAKFTNENPFGVGRRRPSVLLAGPNWTSGTETDVAGSPEPLHPDARRAMTQESNRPDRRDT